MKLLTVVGARPQFIKAAVLSRAIPFFNEGREAKRQVQEVLVHTGQHYDDDMSAVFFEELSIPQPAYHLGVGSGPHGQQTGRMLEGLERVMQAERPDWVMVYGDTNSTLAGGLAAAKLGLPVAHVEAGLRSYTRAMPEETNRVLVDHLSSLLFCPTATAVKNLGCEGIVKGVHLVGDVMAEVLQLCRPLAGQSRILDRLGVTPGGYYLATVHRAENTEQAPPLTGILKALSRLDRPVVFPCHPRTRKMMDCFGIRPADSKRLRLIDPVGYLDMLQLEMNAALILTDSGGVQKEAYWLGVPCVTLRRETEWVETLEGGWNTLAGTDADVILRAIRAQISVHARTERHALDARPEASRLIIEHLTRASRSRPSVRRTSQPVSPAVRTVSSGQAQGFTLWFTGLPGAGKSTLARSVAEALRRCGVSRVEILDGDEMRASLCRGLGFSKADREENIRRIAYLAGVLTRQEVVAIAAAVSPYREGRDRARADIGRLVEVYVKCPVEVLIRRDPKGLYRRALAGEIPQFTGVSDAYEEPVRPDVVVETDRETVEACTSRIVEAIRAHGYL